MAEWAAWYSGDPERIVAVYKSSPPSSGTGLQWYRFWRRAAGGAEGMQRAQLHVPVASDLAQVSGALLFGESPRFRIKEAHEEDRVDAELLDEGAPTKQTSDPAEKTEQRMLEIVARSELRSRLLEAAESAAAIGGVYIYPAWDKDLFDFPVMAIAQADMAVPEFKWGFLVAVTFHRVVDTIGDSNKVWRIVERHEVEGTGETRKAVVLTGLFKGDPGTIGQQVELSAHPSTANVEPRIELPFAELDVQYIPNTRPNRLWRASGHGVADIQGSESLLDAIDETFASWMRDIRLGKARIIVPRDYLRMDRDNENTPTFDIDQEVYTAMEMEPTMNSDARSILAHQFAIRYLEHRSTARELIERVVSNAGYSPATLGQSSDSSGMSRTGAALRVSEHKTVLTQRRKSAHWSTALSTFMRHYLLVDKEFFGGDIIDDVHPMVELSDSVIDQPLELAQTALAMKSAESASTETRVRILHPDWSDAEIAAEVAKITAEVEAAAIMGAEAKFGGTPDAFGDPAKDPKATGNFPRKSQKKGRQTSAPPTPPPFARRQD